MDMKKSVPTFKIILLYKETFLIGIYENFIISSNYSLRSKLCGIISISHTHTHTHTYIYIYINAINVVWKRVIMSYFTKICFIDSMKNVN